LSKVNGGNWLERKHREYLRENLEKPLSFDAWLLKFERECESALPITLKKDKMKDTKIVRYSTHNESGHYSEDYISADKFGDWIEFQEHRKVIYNLKLQHQEEIKRITENLSTPYVIYEEKS